MGSPRINSFCKYLAMLCICLPIVVVPACVHPQSPIALWQFEAGSGTTAIDSSGNGYTLTLVNGISWMSGPVGGAISANAAKDQYAEATAINLSSTRTVTVTFWSKRSYSTSGGHVMLETTPNYNNATTGFGFFPDDSDCQGIQAALHGNAGYTAVCYRQPTSNVWHDFAVIYDKTKSGLSEVMLYIDGVLQTPSGFTYTSDNSNYFGKVPLNVFSRAGTSQFDSGAISNLAIYTSALTAAQVASLYQTGGVVKCQLTATPNPIVLPTTTVGSPTTSTVKITNTCPAAITITSAKASGVTLGSGAPKTPFSLAANQSQNYAVNYTPTAVGQITGSVTILSFAPGDPTLSIPVTGTAIASQTGTLTATPTALSFGNTILETQQTKSLTLTNSGPSTVTVSSVSVTGSGFSLAGVATPFTLSASQTTQIAVNFSPTEVGAVTGALTITSNAQDRSMATTLSGTGITHSAALSWSDSGSSLAGYNIHRSNVANGSYTKLNSALLTSTNYVDETVATGTTYFYVVTAVGNDGIESAYSNQATVVIP
jgi:hypothetical protein